MQLTLQDAVIIDKKKNSDDTFNLDISMKNCFVSIRNFIARKCIHVDDKFYIDMQHDRIQTLILTGPGAGQLTDIILDSEDRENHRIEKTECPVEKRVRFLKDIMNPVFDDYAKEILEDDDLNLLNRTLHRT